MSLSLLYIFMFFYFGLLSFKGLTLVLYVFQKICFVHFFTETLITLRKKYDALINTNWNDGYVN